MAGHEWSWENSLQQFAKHLKSHSREGGNPVFFKWLKKAWIPFFMGMTTFCSDMNSHERAELKFDVYIGRGAYVLIFWLLR
jgi:hypothetical protein